MRTRVAAILALSAVAASATPSTPNIPPIAQPAALVAVAPRSPWTLRELESMGVAFASYDAATGVAHVIATPAEQARLAAAGFALATVMPDVDAGRQPIVATRALGAYHSYAEAESVLADLASRFPQWCRLESIGRSVEGRDLWALKISDDPAVDDATEPDVLFMGCHHAREFMSVEVPLHAARTLLERAATDASLRALVEERELWVVPIVNPDGHVHQEQFAAGPQWAPPGWRKNRRPNFDGTTGVDLNRNYGYQWGLDEEGSSPDGASETYRGSAPWSEPETRAVRGLVERQRFVIALTYHSYGRLWLYPWGHTRSELTDDHAVFAALADSMVRSNGYRAGNAYLGTIYLTNGECTDYLYGEWSLQKPVRTFAFTPELNSAGEGGFWPPESLIDPTCAAMWPANRFALEVAAAPRRPLPPSAPVVAAAQDPREARRIRLDWTQSPDADNPVTHWEVFEIAIAAAPSEARIALETTGRAILGRGVVRPRSGALVVHVTARLASPWDWAAIEVRAAGTSDRWTPVRTASAGAVLGEGGAFSGGFDRRLRFDLAGVAAERLDVALRLDAAESAPQKARIAAALDLGATYGEERRVLAPDVREPRYEIWAERAGLFAYGVTAVDADGQKQDSELFFFVVPAVAIQLHDLEWSRDGTRSRIAWSGAPMGARLEAWARPLGRSERGADAASELARGGLQLVATSSPAPARAGRLAWEALAPRELAVLRAAGAGGESFHGPFVLEEAAGARLAILDIHPNPVRDGGSIDFATGEAGPVVLDVHAADGRRVRTLHTAPRAGGRSRLVWDGADETGRRVASGVYFVRLRQGGAASVRRIAVVR